MNKKDKFLNEIEKDVDTMRIKIMQLEMEKKEALEYIEKTCTYDKHLMGYCRGLKTGEVKTLVYKLGGRNDRENIR